MGQLDGGVAAHARARGDTVEHGALRRADQRAGAGSEVVLVEIDHTDQTVADLAVALAALDVDQRILERFEDALFEILAHGGVDVGDEFINIGRFEIGLGQDEAQGGRRAADGLFHALPIFGLRGELVAGDDRPLAHVNILLGQKNVGGVKAKLGKLLIHGGFLLMLFGERKARRRFPALLYRSNYTIPAAEKAIRSVRKSAKNALRQQRGTLPHLTARRRSGILNRRLRKGGDMRWTSARNWGGEM